MKLKICTIVFMLLIPGSILASEVITAKVAYVGTYGNGDFFVETDKVIGEGCNINAIRFDVPNTHPQVKNWLGIAMSALMSGKSIMFKTNDCFNSYPTMDESKNSFVLLLDK